MENLESKEGDIIYLLRISRGKTYRIISALDRMTLYQLAKAINEAYGFYFDHPFGFYNNLKQWVNSTEQYELFKDMDEESDAKSVQKTKIRDAFNIKGKKMLFLFDYGDNWKFIVELGKISEEAPRGRYPKIIESVGAPPKQY